MKWHEKLYVSEQLKNKQDIVRKEIEKGHYSHRLWMITLCTNGHDQLDIRRCSSLALHGSDPVIVGLAPSKYDAYALVTKMVKDSFMAGMAADLLSYFGTDHASSGGGISS